MNLEQKQREREAAARDWALGRRAASVKAGRMGPILRRWINADVVPIAALMREVAQAYLAGDMRLVATLLDTPTAEISEREQPLRALMEWLLRGESKGRGEDTTYAEDMTLAFMAATITRVARDKATLGSALAGAADAIRDTVQGQFIASVQGASAMQALRERQPETWKQKKSLNRICARLASQVKPQMDAEDRGEVELRTHGSKRVLTVLDHRGEERRLEMRKPDAIAWEVMSLCWRDEADGGTQFYRSLWLGLAGMFLSAAQRVGGWFEVAQERTGRRKHTRTSKLLVLSEAAHEAIRKDVDRWLSHGFTADPMLVPPIDGDYLTVRHRKVTGQRPPKGLLTNPTGTEAWRGGACILAETPWTVNHYALDVQLREDDMAGIMRVAEHRRLAQETFYLPVTMDFRGRIYYRPSWVSPQSGDLGKSLLCFPLTVTPFQKPEQDALVMHMAGLYGGPDKLDKAPLSKRYAWWDTWTGDAEGADKPLTLAAHYELFKRGEEDRIPVQLDGTCNGLQHLSALFRDEQAAPHVNLVPSTLEDRPADIYGVVAEVVSAKLAEMEAELWIARFKEAGLGVDRKLTKSPVMVLPYGGTREAVRLSVKASVLERLHAMIGPDSRSPWHRMQGPMKKADGTKDVGDYAAFAERELHDHPGFNGDVARLSALVWDSIAPVIPRAMAAMATLQAIGGWVGERGLAWRVGTGPEETRLWVVQAKSKASRKQVTMRGFHLPDMVRRLTLMANTNEVDPKAHRTGIVANFIHSQDAAHLAATVSLFRARGGGCVGSVHDCLMVRPSEAKLMGECLRDAFVTHYLADPLAQPVKLIAVDGGEDVHYESWYAVAEAAGVSFPDKGTFDITEVKQSAWFFS